MSYVQLTLEERFVIYHLSVIDFGVREIARRLNRHHSTISRELKRNGPRDPGAMYNIGAAHSLSDAAKATCPASSPQRRSSAVPIRGRAS